MLIKIDLVKDNQNHQKSTEESDYMIHIHGNMFIHT